jgi:hypothetical protein
MGRSVTCNYHCTASLSNGQNPIFGAMSLKEAYKNGQSCAIAEGAQLVKISVFAQTASGRKAVKKDFIIIDAWNNKDHYYMEDKIPFYTF